VQGDLISQVGPIQVWATPLQDGSRAVIFFNRHTYYNPYNATVSVSFEDLGFEPNTTAQIRDLYAREDVGVMSNELVWNVPPHDVFVAKVTPTQMLPHYVDWRPSFVVNRR